MIRSLICTFVGHVDHGKTTIQDSIRGTAVAAKEAGLITQCISCTNIPFKVVEKIAHGLVNFKVRIPGFLFLDTPGHAAFTNLRKRGGNLADIAVLVVDINEGFKPQTIEALEILKQYKTPFVIAANKIDLIPGYRIDNKKGLIEDIKSQPQHIIEILDNKIYELVGKLAEFGFNSERFDRVEDYGKQIAIIPVSAKKKEGLPELMMVLAGLASKFLEKDLEINEKSKGKATVLEVKDEIGLGITLDVIVYDGVLKKGDTIIIGTLGEPIVTKVKALFEPTDVRGVKFKSVNDAVAAIGVKISATEIEEVISGMPLRVADKDSVERIQEEIKKEVEEVLIDTDNDGIVVKADSLGSLEALVGLLRERDILIKRATIGDVVKRDIAEAKSEDDELKKVILAFNVEVKEKNKDVKIISHNVIYKIIEDYEKWIETESKKKEMGILENLPKLCKVRKMGGYVFRQSNPAVVGVEILSGVLKSGTVLMKNGKKVAEAKTIQLDGENINEAGKGKQVAVAFPNVTIGRQINSEDIMYSFVSENEFRQLKKMKKYLSIDEIQILKEVAEINRKNNAVWGV